MSNPTRPRGGFPADQTASSVPGIGQFVSDQKFATKIQAAGVWPAAIDFFQAAPGTDQTEDYYDAGNQLVTSGKSFTIQNIGVHIYSADLHDYDAIIHRVVLVLTVQQKEVGRFRVRRLTEAGGLWLASAQSAAASHLGASNGTPHNSPFNIAPITIDTNQTFKATLLGPTRDPYTLIDQTTIQVVLEGFETRPVA